MQVIFTSFSPPRTHAHKGRVRFVRFCLLYASDSSDSAPIRTRCPHPSGRKHPFFVDFLPKMPKMISRGEYPFLSEIGSKSRKSHFPFLPELWRKYRKNYPAVIKCYLFDYPPPFCKSLFFSKARQCKSMLFSYSP